MVSPDSTANVLDSRDQWQPGMALVDFTNPEAWKWYSDLVQKLVETGVDTLKTDFGERIPHVDIKYHDGSDPWKMHKCVHTAQESPRANRL